jgi:cytoskeleton protein RodZ
MTTSHFTAGQQVDSATGPPSGPGGRLRAARQAQGLELDQIAAELHLSAAVIELIEQEDHAALPSQVFVVGYIRKYARVVGLDPEPLLVAYRATAPQPRPSRTTALPVAPQVGSGHLLVRIVSLGILILTATLTFLWWQGHQPDVLVGGIDSLAQPEAEEEQAPEPLVETPPAGAIGADPIGGATGGEPATPVLLSPPRTPEGPPASNVPEERTTAARTPEEIDLERAESPRDDAQEAGATASTQDAAPSVAALETDEAQTTAPAREIVLSFTGPCWVDVRDSERKYKLFGEMKKGDRRTLEGQPPYSVILGNAAAVQITVGGEAFDFSALSKGNVARFNLDPQRDRGPWGGGQEGASSVPGPLP